MSLVVAPPITNLVKGAIIVANLMTMKQAAERLKVDISTISRWLGKDRFPNAYRKDPLNPKSHWLIPEADIKAFEEKRRGDQL